MARASKAEGAGTGRAVAPVRAILTDVDGTLYRHSLLRKRMARELLWACLRSPLSGWTTVRAIRAYRRSQEQLRAEGFQGDVAAEQLARACRASRLTNDFMMQCVEQWMEHHPLAYLAAAAQPGVISFFEWARSEGIGLAAVSDYNPRRKLEALGLGQHFEVIVCAQDPEVGCFKPNPRALEIAADKLGVRPEEALYVGDREDVDVAAARRLRMQAALLTPHSANVPDGCLAVRSFAELRDILKRSEAPRRRGEFTDSSEGITE